MNCAHQELLSTEKDQLVTTAACIMLSLPIKLENVLRQAVKKWSSAFYFQNFKTTHDRFWGGGGVNYQMQIVTTKLPNENIQTYKLQMIDSGEGELPNANCDYQTTK